MVAHKREPTPLEYLSNSDREFAEGNHRQSAFFLWKATESVFIKIAQTQGLDPDDLITVARNLDEQDTLRKHYYLGHLSTGWALRDHAEMDLMEDHELAEPREATRRFIQKCSNGDQ